jgi:hypothetical protein
LSIEAMESARHSARAGVTQIYRSVEPVHRVLLLDGRWDGLPVAVENLIAGNLDRAGLQIDLDAVSDPDGTTRVLADYPDALDGYDAVIAVSPRRPGRRRASRSLIRIIDRVSARTPVLLIDHLQGDEATGSASPIGSRLAGQPVDTLLLPLGVETISAARQIAAALHVLLDQLDVRRPAPPILVVIAPTAATVIRDDLGALAVGRLDWIARVARDTFGLAFAEVNLLRSGSITTIASSRDLPEDHPAAGSLTALAMRTSGITVIADVRGRADADDRATTSETRGIRFYAACPIRSNAGTVIGTLCISDTSPHQAAEFDLTALSDLALLTEGEIIDACQQPA